MVILNIVSSVVVELDAAVLGHGEDTRTINKVDKNGREWRLTRCSHE